MRFWLPIQKKYVLYVDKPFFSSLLQRFFLQLVGLFRAFNGRFDGITTRWTLNNDPRILVELEKLGYVLRELDKPEFENKLRKTEVSEQL